MAYVSLARRYRPQLFSDLIGQELVVASLRGGLQKGIVPHSMVFSGPRGTGKTTTCRILAKALNCQNLSNQAEPCLKCESCQALLQGSIGGYFEVDGASYNGVDMVRDLISSFGFLPPAPFKVKFYVIDEAHMLSNAAFNAMLKSIEEPPSHVYIALVTTEPHKIPDTIMSRCVHFELQPTPPAILLEHLRKLAEKEGILIEDWILWEICKLARNSVRDALTLLDRYWLLRISGQDSLVTKWLASSRDARYVDLILAILSNDYERSVSIFRSLCSEANDVDNVIKHSCEMMSEFLIYFSSPKPEPNEAFEKLKDIFKTMPLDDIVEISLDLFRYGDLALKSVFKQPVFEAGLVRLCHRSKYIKSVDMVSHETKSNEQPSQRNEEKIEQALNTSKLNDQNTVHSQDKNDSESKIDETVPHRTHKVPESQDSLSQDPVCSGQGFSVDLTNEKVFERTYHGNSVSLDPNRFCEHVFSSSKLAPFQNLLTFEISASESEIYLSIQGGRIAVETARKEEKTLKAALKKFWPNFKHYHIVYERAKNADEKESSKKNLNKTSAISEGASDSSPSSIEEEFERKMQLVGEMLAKFK